MIANQHKSIINRTNDSTTFSINICKISGKFVKIRENMGQKVHPTAFRLGFVKDWTSRWFSIARYKQFLIEDIAIRELIEKKLARSAAVERVEIERSANLVNIIIHTARPGILIGRGGTGVETIKKEIESRIFKMRRLTEGFKMPKVRVEIREVRNPESFASLVAYDVANALERRVPYRRVLKQAIGKTFENKKIEGVKISVSGRLDGAEIARIEWLAKGKIPLHTLRADIDYFHANAYTTYGVIGVKVWLYKGEVFSDKPKENQT